ncbi:unnamed protein product, partial [Thlaspi arvense]
IKSSAEQCGWQVEGALCLRGLYCNKYGWCSSTKDYGSDGCQSHYDGATLSPCPNGNINNLISRSMFNQMLLHCNDVACPTKNFYTYYTFIKAAKSFSAFGTTGNIDNHKREIVAFLAQTSHETTGRWPSAPEGPFAWGYYYLKEQGNPPDYCVPSVQWPCAPAKKYWPRPNPNFLVTIITWTNREGRRDSSVVLDDLTVPKPSCYNVITGQWTSSVADQVIGESLGMG